MAYFREESHILHGKPHPDCGVDGTSLGNIGEGKGHLVPKKKKNSALLSANSFRLFSTLVLSKSRELGAKT